MKKCESNARLVSLYAKRLGKGQWSFLVLGSKMKWYSISEDSPQGEWDRIAEKMMLGFAESGHPIFRATSPLSRGQLQSKGHGKLSIHYCADLETIKTVFRTIDSVNQLSHYGAVAEKCEEYESCHAGRPVVGEQSSSSFVPNVIKTNILLNDDPANEKFLLQRCRKRIEKLSQQDRLSKFCIDAGFLTTVEVGQYLMTKDTEEFSQFTDSVACRDYTLPRDEDSSEPKGWIRGNTQIGLYWKFTTCCLQGEYGVGIRIMSVNKDNSHSWVRISHDLNKLVTELSNNKENDNNEQLDQREHPHWPVLEVTTSYLYGKHGIEIRIWSLSQDNSHSWVRISHDLNKLVTELSNNKENNNNEQETSEMQFEEYPGSEFLMA